LAKSLLIGDNAFIGVNHLSLARGRQKLSELGLKPIAETMMTAISCGANGFTFSAHPTNLKILDTLIHSGLPSDFGIWPVLPYAAGYIRTVNETGIKGLIDDVMSKLSFSDKARLLSKGALSALTLDPIRLMKTYLDMELANIVSLKGVNLTTVMLHEVITDLGISLEAKQLFHSFLRHIRDRYDVMPGFVTRNFVKFVEFFERYELSLDGVAVMTPVNRIGFQMNPSRESCEAVLSRMTHKNVVAMSIMAGGYLGLDEAIDYLGKLKNLSGIAVGVSSKEHAEHTFTRLRALNQT
jgi:hypothetical protein